MLTFQKPLLKNLKNIPALSLLVVFFCVGIVIGRYLEITFYVVFSFLAISLVSGIISFYDEKKFEFSVIVFSLVFGISAFKNTLILPQSHINNLKPNLLGQTLIEGRVINDPYANDKTQLLLEVEKIKLENYWRGVRGKVLVNIFAKRDISYSDRLILEGKFFKPYSFAGQNQPNFNYPQYLRQKGIFFIFNVKEANAIKKLGPTPSNPILKLTSIIKHHVKDSIYKHIPVVPADFLSAILLGERQEIEPQLKNVFIQTGTAHILAISGLHVGIIAFIFLLFFKALRIPRKWRYSLVVALLIVYCFLTGCRPSVVRATLMATVLLFGYLIDRQANIYNSLSFAALIILLLNPWNLFDVGFQLSFISVISIVLLSPKIERAILRVYQPKNKIINFIFKAFCVSIAAWMGTWPLITYYFGIFSAVTVVANLIVVPFMSIVLALGLTFIFVASILPILAGPFALSISVSIVFLIKICSLLASLPFAYIYVNPPSIFAVILYYILLVLVSLLAKMSLYEQIDKPYKV